MIPTSVITGFLGCGKTTFISRILRDPAFARTAVIVNEFGEIGLDHDLIESSDESVVTLSSGCLCCAAQSDLALTLLDLLRRRDAGEIAYDRVLIETSGLSDPLPLLQAMMIDSFVSATHRIAGVMTLVDTVHGEQTLRQHAEARHQVALADRILLSKTDIQPPSPELSATLDRLNPAAPRMTTVHAGTDLLATATDLASLAAQIASLHRTPGHADIEALTVIREQPIPALALTLLLQALAEHCGPRMLRLKGLVAIREMPGRPAVIHGVRHVVSPPDFLDHWPSGDRRTRIVFIVRGVPRHFIARLLDAIEHETRDAAALPD